VPPVRGSLIHDISLGTEKPRTEWQLSTLRLQPRTTVPRHSKAYIDKGKAGLYSDARAGPYCIIPSFPKSAREELSSPVPTNDTFNADAGVGAFLRSLRDHRPTGAPSSVSVPKLVPYSRSPRCRMKLSTDVAMTQRAKQETPSWSWPMYQ